MGCRERPSRPGRGASRGRRLCGAGGGDGTGARAARPPASRPRGDECLRLWDQRFYSCNADPRWDRGLAESAARRGQRGAGAAFVRAVSGPPGPAPGFGGWPGPAPAPSGPRLPLPAQTAQKMSTNSILHFSATLAGIGGARRENSKGRRLFMAGKLESGTIWWDLSRPAPSSPGPPKRQANGPLLTMSPARPGAGNALSALSLASRPLSHFFSRS